MKLLLDENISYRVVALIAHSPARSRCAAWVCSAARTA